jgi:hypothetical protein
MANIGREVKEWEVQPAPQALPLEEAPVERVPQPAAQPEPVPVGAGT